MRTIIISTLLVLSVLIAAAQNNNIDSLNVIRVGGKLPSSLIDFKNKLLDSNGITEFSLSVHTDKLIIIDFWANWCGPCVYKLPLLDSLQHQYPKELKIVLVNSVGTGDKNEAILETLRTKTGQFGMPLRSVIEDKLFLKAFPHRTIPHYVWVSGGTVVGITSGDFLSRELVEKMIKVNNRLVESRRKLMLLRGGRPLKKVN